MLAALNVAEKKAVIKINEATTTMHTVAKIGQKRRVLGKNNTPNTVETARLWSIESTKRISKEVCNQQPATEVQLICWRNAHALV